MLAYIYALREAKRRGIEIKHIDNMAFWLILAGVLGARIYYVLFNFQYFSENPAQILQIWKGGLAIHGALFWAVPQHISLILRFIKSTGCFMRILLCRAFLSAGSGALEISLTAKHSGYNRFTVEIIYTFRKTTARI